MEKKLFAGIVALLLVFSFMVSNGSAHSRRNKSRKNQPTKESLIYGHLFYLIAAFDEKSGDARHFQEQANLTDEQEQKLENLARNFTSVFPLISGRQRLALSLQYKYELKRLFGADEFRRFDEYVKSRIAPGIRIIESDKVLSTGSSSISVDENQHQLRGVATTIIFLFAPSTESCFVSANMTGPNVSVSGSSSNCTNGNPSVELTSNAYLPNSEYCIYGSHGDGGTSSACLMTANQARVTKVEYEQIAGDDLPIDNNPNAGNGLRIFSDDKIPNDPVDRRKIRVKAQYNSPTAGVRIYFRNFDADDPSANGAPIDPNDTNGNNGDDNIGTVDGNANTKAGVLSIPQGANYCQPYQYGISCLTDTNGIATVDFTVTMQPGDNFTVAASPDDTYLSGLMPTADGINLKDGNNVPTPVTTIAQNFCANAAVAACRADLLTVWRRLHLEVDSMGNVGLSNNITGTIVSEELTQCPRTPQTPPCVENRAYVVNNSPALENHRFDNGRIKINVGPGDIRSFNILGNENNIIVLNGNPPGSSRLGSNVTFTLYDDDDYNADDTQLDGDFNEPIIRLPESFKYLSAEDGNYPDGKPKNVYASAYIMPEYNWAQNVANYNQVNVGFILNEPVSNLTTLINMNRNSSSNEKNDFWIAYLLIAYQGAEDEDGDGESKANSGIAPPASSSDFCDCYQSSNCIGSACTLIPKGIFGSLIYQEVMQDVTRSYLRDANLAVEIKGTTVAHEIGHQFGLDGDNRDPMTHLSTRSVATYRIMDYPHRPSETDDYGFHPEHINILRRRIKSPGE